MARLTCIAVGFATAQPVNAADGPAPSSQERRVVSGVHADAVSVFAENSGLTLGSKADVDGSLGVRLDPNLTLFNVEDAARTTIPNLPSLSFLGAPGSDVWIAPETNPGGALLWPGFSTEGVPTGVVDGNQMTLRLEAVSGPGTLHVFQSDVFGEPIRRFSSTGTVYREWTLPRGTHAHANWAFSAAGSYTLTFIANALTNGVSISATQNYTFVVGNVPAAVATTTILAASTNSIVLGTAVTLDATVVPNNAVGYLEFREGATILGHVANVTGSATLTTTNLLLGARSVTARFVPQWLNDFSASTSAPVAITVTEPSGVPFSITGVVASYQVGDVLNAQTVGYTLGENDQFGFQVRPIGANEDPATCCSTYLGEEVNPEEIAAGHLTLTADLGWDGYEIRAVAREGVYNEEEDYWTYNDVAFTPWVPISVAHPDDVDPISTVFPSSAYEGDEITLPLSRPLAEGESVRVVYREWSTLYSWPGILYPTGREATVVDDTLVTTIPWGAFNHPEWLTKYAFAIQVIRDSLVVAQSEPTVVPLNQLEVLLEGLNPVYRIGQPLSVTANVYPPRDEFTYEWYTYDEQFNRVTLSTNRTLDVEALDLSWNGRFVVFSVFSPERPYAVASLYPSIVVSDADPDEQLFFLESLAYHYHQGEPVKLTAVADPGLAEGDTIIWEWLWPGTVWAPLPGATGSSHQLTAEQAFDGVQVRATLAFAHTNTTIFAAPVTIFVDDHGAVARQQPTVAGVTSYTAGQQATLTRQLPANGPTILTAHRWERKAAGAPEFTVIPGATNATLSFITATADDGAQYRVSILKPTGALAYGPSPAVALDVTESVPLRPVILDLGHIDLFELTWNTNSGQLDLKVKDDSGLYSPHTAFRQPENVTILVDTALSEQMFGDDDLPPGYEFIPRNQPFYLLDWSQQDGLPWPGWSTERLLGSLPEGVTIPFDTGSVELGVTVEGPGDVVTFIDEGFGTPSNRFIDTTDAAPDVIVTGSSIHYHTAWLFTKPGDYLLTVTPRAYPAFPSKTNALTGPAQVYHFRVGPRPDFETLPDGFEVSITGAPFSVTNDTPVNLQLVLSGPQPAIGGYQWYHFVGEEGQQPVAGATNPAVSLTVDPWDSALVVLFDPTGRVLTETSVQFLPPPGPPGASHNVSGHSDAPATAGVSWATVYDGRSPLTRQVVTLIPQAGDPIVQEVTGSVNDAAFSGVPAGTYTATVQAFNALGAGAVSAPSAPFTVEPPALSIARTGVAPGTVTLVIATRSGKIHQLESAPAVTGPWTNLGDPISGTGQTVPVVVPHNGPAGFFRWRTVENP